jgi:peroxiredoxin
MKHITLLLLIAVALPAISQNPEKFGINSEAGVPEGLKEGIMAPDFAGIDQNGKTVRLTDQLKKGPVVLIFYRGYWCPVCNKYLDQFQKDIDLLLEKGASVIAVSPEANDGVEKTITKNNLTFSILSDKGYQIMDKYGVRFLVTDGYSGKIKTFLGASIAENNNDDKPYLPIPATYIIGKNGEIVKTFFDQNYKNRPTAEEIAKYLD